MSEQRLVVGLDGQARPITESDQTRAKHEAEKLARSEKRARFVRVLERGFTVDRLSVPNLPPHLHGEWVPTDQIERWQTLGFVDGTEYAAARGLHDKGRVADCVFMVQSKEDHELYEEVRQELFIMQHGSPKEKERLKQKEEVEYTNVIENQIGLPVVDESVERQARKEEIKEALNVASTQIPPASRG